MLYTILTTKKLKRKNRERGTKSFADLEYSRIVR